MADKIKPENDPPLNKQQAEAGWRITPPDVARSLTKWRRRLPNIEARITEAAK